MSDLECPYCGHEQDNGLFGYPPEIVSVGLVAIDKSECPYEAIDSYISGE